MVGSSRGLQMMLVLEAGLVLLGTGLGSRAHAACPVINKMQEESVSGA